MSHSERGQVSRSAAQIYEEFFVPALFEQWTGRVVDGAQIESGERVLDVACGTGVLTRAAAERVGSEGSAAGIDPNEGMLAVARRKAPQIEWRQGVAEQVPFDDSSFDAVVSQFGLMFFDNRETAIREMVRVLRPGGRLGVAVWDSLDNTPGYAAMTEILQRLFGDREANALRAPYVMGDRAMLRSLFEGAGVAEVEITTHPGTARFPSIESWVHTDVRGWTLADLIDDGQFKVLLAEAKRSLGGFLTAQGTVAFSAPAHVVSATKH